MSVQNHCEHFRPLVGGVVIVAAQRQSYGTLGAVVRSGSGQLWGLTCAHVLGPPGGPVPDGDAVFQPDTSAASHRVGRTNSDRSDQALDAAAFEIDAGVLASSRILGVRTHHIMLDPVVGMHVIKSGRSTGVTEGVVDRLDDRAVHIRLLSEFPRAYDLSDAGDSGSVWCEFSSGKPTALHRGGTAGHAEGFAIRPVMAALGLVFRPLQGG